MNIKLPKRLFITFILLLIALGLFIAGPFLAGPEFSGFFIKAPLTSAQSLTCPDPNIFGYAWSPNIGWISMSGTAQDSSKYGACLDQSTGILTGHAWSPNIGWIQFDPNSESAPELPKYSAKLENNAIKGWAKAYAPILAGGATSGGWDGWIKMSGTALDTSLYGVNVNPSTGDWSGYAWGGDVIGWVDFSNVFIDTNGNIVDPAQLSVSLAANPSYTSNSSLNNVSLTANVSGAATGQITYNFYCNSSDSNPVITFTTDAGSQIASDLCDYSSSGNYSARVTAIRGNYYAQDMASISVGMPVSCSSDSSCPAGQECDLANGVCKNFCPVGQTRDTNGNCVSSCSSNIQCPSGQECVSGGCAAVCGYGQTRVYGVCVSSCSSNTQCPSEQECVSGGCFSVCSSDQTRDASGICRGSGSGGTDITLEIGEIINNTTNETEIVTSQDVGNIIEMIINPANNVLAESSSSQCQGLDLNIGWNKTPALNQTVMFTGFSNSSNISRWIWMFKGEIVDLVTGADIDGNFVNGIDLSQPNKSKVKFVNFGGVSNKTAVVLGVQTSGGEVCYASRIIFAGGITEE